MKYNITINLTIENNEVPDLRESVGWGRRGQDYPELFERCNFWAGARDDQNRLIAFGYVCGMGLEHGYMEDIIVDPEYQGQGLGMQIVQALLEESERYGLEIVTVTFDSRHTRFYQSCGFTAGSGGVWERST
ncbi:GNAT family N-acetyltransferase [Alteribacillus sp. HJP-4]|uniref:GNAT family N-acetyltransferase n=1 Tax=Alteribacillus sp. HJP-4 TaxID=2775394 RepID=UPI0035CD29AA